MRSAHSVAMAADDRVRDGGGAPSAPVQPHLRTLARRASIEARSEIADAFALVSAHHGGPW